MVFPLVLAAVLFFVPESPRWLCMNDRADEATKVLIALHKRSNDPDDTFALQEMQIIVNQINYEKRNRLPVREAFRKPSLLKRFALGFLAMWNTQCSGLIVVLGKARAESLLICRIYADIYQLIRQLSMSL